MYIERLILKETFPNEKVIRNIIFSKGMNLIVDSDNSEKGNNVGKTTALRIIDICLGAKDVKNIYIDSETKAKNSILEQYIVNNKVTAELIVTTSLEEDNPQKINYSLKVELFPRGKRYINNERMNQQEYFIKLKTIFFENNNDAVSFRQLIKKFVRIDLKGDNDKFLKFLHPSTTNNDYNNIYSTLFQFNDDEINQKYHDIFEKLQKLDSDLKTYKRIHSYQDENELTQRIGILKTKIRDSNTKLDSLVNSKEFKLNEEEVLQIRANYKKLQDQLELVNFEKNRAQEILKDSKASFKEIDEDVLKTLYQETKSVFSKLSKEFSQLVEFNSQLFNNKTAFYEKLVFKKEQEATEIKNLLDSMFEKNKDAILLINSKNVEQYYEIQKELEMLQESIGRLKEVYETIKNFQSKKEDLQGKLDKIEVDDKRTEERITFFNKYFPEYSNQLSKESYVLFQMTGESSFPLGISGSINGTFSTGTKKSTILAFDLAYLMYAEHYNIKCPKFIIHDVLESMDEQAFKSLVDIITDIDGQYIVAVLKEKIDSYNFISDASIKLKLSTNNKLFKV